MIILYITILFLTVVYTCWYLKTKMESYKKLTAANTESIQVYQFVQLHNCKGESKSELVVGCLLKWAM